MKNIKTREMILGALFTALIAVGAFIRIPMPFMDYITLQIFFVMLAGLLLGPKVGTISTAAYVILGLMGVPVFTGGGGFTYVLMPTFGYLIGFVFTAFIGGKLSERNVDNSFKKYFLIAVISLIPTYLIGMIYKFLILNFYLGEDISIWSIVLITTTVMIPKDILMAALAGFLCKKTKKAIKF